MQRWLEVGAIRLIGWNSGQVFTILFVVDLQAPRTVEPAAPIQQLSFFIEVYPLLLQQLQLLTLIDPAGRLLPLALEAADEAVGSDDAVAGYFGREWVVAKGSADGARGGVESRGEDGVGCYAAGWDLAEECVNALEKRGQLFRG
jgi:hypothetical protein